MATNTLINVISERCIKPSFPTPPSNRYYKFSSVDQDQFDFLVSVAFFYHPEGKTQLCELLEASLSYALTYYYPFAGRIIDETCVDCNDAGVLLWDVQVQASMSEILDQQSAAKDLLFPRGQHSSNSLSGQLLLVQLNRFECGAVCVAISYSHKLGDAQTICNFMNDWAAIAVGSPETTPSPMLDGNSIFPLFDHPCSKPSISFKPKSCVTRRFVFSASRISKLKAKVAADSSIKNPSKVEVITALIFKSAMAAARANSDSFRPSLLSQTANFRSLTIPPLSEKHEGNFVSNFEITANKEEETEFTSLVGKLRKSKVEFQKRHRKELTSGNKQLKLQIRNDREELGKIISSNSFDVYLFSSWCRFPFYEVDFGWGKPIFVCMPNSSMKNTVFFVDTKNGDGVEAYVTLEEDDMSILEQDEEFLDFASLTPETTSEINA